MNRNENRTFSLVLELLSTKPGLKLHIFLSGMVDYELGYGSGDWFMVSVNPEGRCWITDEITIANPKYLSPLASWSDRDTERGGAGKRVVFCRGTAISPRHMIPPHASVTHRGPRGAHDTLTDALERPFSCGPSLFSLRRCVVREYTLPTHDSALLLSARWKYLHAGLQYVLEKMLRSIHTDLIAFCRSMQPGEMFRRSWCLDPSSTVRSPAAAGVTHSTRNVTRVCRMLQNCPTESLSPISVLIRPKCRDCLASRHVSRATHVPSYVTVPAR